MINSNIYSVTIDKIFINDDENDISSFQNTENYKIIYIGNTTQPLSKKFYDLKKETKKSKCAFYNYIIDNYNGNFSKWKINLLENYNATDKQDLENKTNEYINKYIDDGYTVINKLYNECKTLSKKEQYEVWKNKQLELNPEEFKLKNIEKSKKYYNKNIKKPDIKINETVIIPKLAKSKKYKKNTNSNPIFADTTKTNYIYIINLIYNNYNTTPLDINHDIFNYINGNKYKAVNITKTFKFIKDNIKDIIYKYYTYINQLYSIFSHIRGFADVIKHLEPYKNFKNDTYIDNKHNYIPPDELLSKINFNDEEIINNIRASKLENNRKLVHCIFTLIPTKRPSEYRKIKIIDYDPTLNINIDKKFNYYYYKKIYIYNMKSNKNKEILIIDVPEIVDELINKNNVFLFQYKNNINGYTASGFNAFIKKTFNDIYNYPFNPNFIRRLYATYINKSSFNPIKRKEIAKIMNHSLTQQVLYSY
jgi:hypothetical protein